jgi:arginine decarboxylase
MSTAKTTPSKNTARTSSKELIKVLGENEIPHPTIVTESGRATVSYASILLFNILDITRLEPRPLPKTCPKMRTRC